MVVGWARALQIRRSRALRFTLLASPGDATGSHVSRDGRGLATTKSRAVSLRPLSCLAPHSKSKSPTCEEGKQLAGSISPSVYTPSCLLSRPAHAGWLPPYERWLGLLQVGAILMVGVADVTVHVQHYFRSRSPNVNFVSIDVDSSAAVWGACVASRRALLLLVVEGEQSSSSKRAAV